MELADLRTDDIASAFHTCSKMLLRQLWLCTYCHPVQMLCLVHRLAEGRQPWSGAPIMPEAELGEHETGVWALAANDVGSTVVTGTDEGAVTAWDLRARRAIWQARRAWGARCRNAKTRHCCVHVVDNTQETPYQGTHVSLFVMRQTPRHRSHLTSAATPFAGPEAHSRQPAIGMCRRACRRTTWGAWP